MQHTADYAAEAAPGRAAKLGGARSTVDVPMLKDGVLIGAISIYRQEVRPFTDKQIELLRNFAAQAVIAIENTRLLNELRQRTSDLTESLEQQTATSEVLSVISSSPGALEPVFQAMLENAVRICQAKFGFMLRYDGEAYHTVASLCSVPAYSAEMRRGPIRPDADSALGLVAKTGQVAQIPDITVHRLYAERNALFVAGAELGGIRTIVVVPMLKDNKLIGAITIFRQEVRPFTDKQIELVQNFAAQAVIAIENTRLLNELRESLDRQTATADILRVIAGAPEDSARALDAIAETAVRMFDAAHVNFRRIEGDILRIVCAAGPAMGRVREVLPDLPLESTDPAVRSVFDSRQIAVEDRRVAMATERSEIAHVLRDLPIGSQAFTPLSRQGEAIGVMIVSRSEVRPFVQGELDLMTGFADQAVIAIENARLLSELRQSLEQQTATADVLRVISSSPGELEPVFNAMLENATRICEAKFGVLQLCEDGGFRMVAMHNAPPAYAEARRRAPVMHPSPLAPPARVAATKRLLHIADLAEEQVYKEGDASATRFVEMAGVRTLLVVPMLKEQELIGEISVYRQEVRPFTDKQIELVQNFAAQAVIAIENTRLLSELRQSLEQQTATSEVLQVISSSPGELEPVFQAMLENATRICEAKFGSLLSFDGEKFQLAAEVGTPPEFGEVMRQRGPFSPVPGSHLDRVMRTMQLSHTADYAAEAVDSPPVRFGGARSTVDVPMLKDGALVGVVSIYRQEVRPFTDKQIALLQNFAAQAVIAIENTRLLNELRQRTDDLTESLEQQTAIGEILRVISNSPSDVQPVLDSVAEHAARICEAQIVDIFLVENDMLRDAASFGDLGRPPAMRLDRSTVSGRSICDLQPVHIVDLHSAGEEFALGRELAIKFGHRSILAVPLIREGRALGTILVRRTEVRPFEQKDIALLTTFADQAAIAIENVRLFEAEQQRTHELAELLEQQTATSEVLRVISSSPGELVPVFQAMLENAVRICDAKFGVMFRYDRKMFHPAATFGLTPEYAAFLRQRGSFEPRTGSGLDRLLQTKDVVHIADDAAGPTPGGPAAFGGARSRIVVPMLKDAGLVGAITIYRQEVRPFSDKQIELVQNFAAQAVIAIENTRLLNELRQSLEQQTATADVLKVISRSTFDLQTVLDTLTELAARVCAADKGVIFQRDGDLYRLGANYGFSREAAQYALDNPQRAGRGSAVGRVALEGRAIHIPDVLADPDYSAAGYQRAFGFRTILGVPLLREGTTIGVFALTRDKVHPFSQQQIDLVTTFADQAVIAIENVRLFEDVQKRTEELSDALEQQTATADVLKIISRSTFDLQTVLDTLAELAVRLCEADIASIHRQHGANYQAIATFGGPSDHARTRLRQAFHSRRDAGTDHSAARYSSAGRFRLRTFWPIRTIRCRKCRKGSGFAPSSASRCCAKTIPSASSC